MPIGVILERTKLQLVQAFNKIESESKLPSCLYEGLLLDILADIRERKNLELISYIEKEKEDHKPEQEENDVMK